MMKQRQQLGIAVFFAKKKGFSLASHWWFLNNHLATGRGIVKIKKRIIFCGQNNLNYIEYQSEDFITPHKDKDS